MINGDGLPWLWFVREARFRGKWREREGKGSTLTSPKVQVLDALLESPQPPCWSPRHRRLLAPEVEVRRKSTAQPVIVLSKDKDKVNRSQ
jgi:hypothetical protein